MQIELKPEYLTGNKTLDGQHQKLIELCSRLANHHCFSPSENSAYHEILNLLIDLSREHFHAEERLLKEVGYPDLVDHQKSHAKHELELCKLVDKVLREHLDNSVITSSIVHWLISHMEEDAKHKDYFKENNNE